MHKTPSKACLCLCMSLRTSCGHFNGHAALQSGLADGDHRVQLLSLSRTLFCRDSQSVTGQIHRAGGGSPARLEDTPAQAIFIFVYNLQTCACAPVQEGGVSGQ
jgi:hypothetical protein